MPDSNRYRLLHGGLILLTLILAVGSLCLGQYRLSVSNVLSQLLMLATPDGPAGQIVWSVRLPRILMALLAGGALGLCGTVLQGVFQNPLVDPHIIGVTSGSAFGGTLAILLGFSPMVMIASTFSFGLAALMLVWLIAALQGRENTLVLILSGIIMSGFFAALVSLMQYMADTEETLPNIVFWLLGSFATANWHKVLMLALPVSIVSSYCCDCAGALTCWRWKKRTRWPLVSRSKRCAAACWSVAPCWFLHKWRSAAALPGLGW